MGAAYGGRDYVCLQNEYNSEPSLTYHTTRGKVELEYDLHSVYTIHSEVRIQKLKSHSRYKVYKNGFTGSNVDMVWNMLHSPSSSLL